MTLLRDLRESTKLLILLELTSRQHTKIRTLAEKLDMTVQGMSEYVKMMSSDGLIQSVGGIYKATKKGVEFLQQRVQELRQVVDAVSEKLDIIDVCEAFAGTDLSKGEKVGLFMEDGYLVAYVGRKSHSQGKVLFGAKKGEDVGITDLEGIVDLKPGKIWICELPTAREKGSRRVDFDRLKKLVRREKIDRVGVDGATARVVASKASLQYDFEFSCVSASLEAAQKGLNVLLLCGPGSSVNAVSSVMETNTVLEDKIPFEVLNLKVGKWG